MKVKLKEIATIQTGLFSNSFVDGDIVYLQTKHFNEYGALKNTLHPDLEGKGIDEKHLLRNGDVLFAAKGSRNFAAAFVNIDQPCVASTSFFVIRLKNYQIMPEYLSWYLNHPITLQFLKSQAIGTSIVSISKPVLEEIEISFPSIETQKNVLQIVTLRKKEIELKQKIESLRELQVQQLIINAIK